MLKQRLGSVDDWLTRVRPSPGRYLVHDIVLTRVLGHLESEIVARSHFDRRRMIDLQRLDALAEIGGVSANVDHVTNAQRTGLQPHGRD
jgi:hypothetical protein